jgi:hypothetical protein
MRDIGRPDIVFVIDIGSEWISDFEIWVIEVKKKKKNILDSLTQTLKYSLFAHRCYLAVKFSKKEKGFTTEDIHFAENFGIGLIEFKDNKVNIINFSKKFNPISAKVDEAMENLDLTFCNICNNYVNDNDIEKNYDVELFTSWLNQGKFQKRKMRYSKDNKRTICICKDCYKKIFSGGTKN